MNTAMKIIDSVYDAGARNALDSAIETLEQFPPPTVEACVSILRGFRDRLADGPETVATGTPT